MRINTRFPVAVHILATAAFCTERPATSELIAKSVNTNPVVIRRITAMLKKANLVAVRPGIGGIILRRPSKEITLRSIYEAVQEPEKEVLFDLHRNPNQQCPIGANIRQALSEPLASAQEAMEKSLEQYTLHDILCSVAKNSDLTLKQVEGEKRMERVIAMYFSPTGTSKKIAEAIAHSVSQELACPMKTVDLTQPEDRDKGYAFAPEDVLVLAYPVYAGRVPEVLQQPLRRLKGKQTPAILAAVYGNRDYEDALIEGRDILSENGFAVVGAGAFIGEHSYSKLVATDRPDEQDLQSVAAFGKKLSEKLKTGIFSKLEVKGNRPYKDPMPNLPFVPKTKETCIDCGICAAECPVGAIHKENPRIVDQTCILCSACVKGCPEEAKYIDAEPIMKIKAMLEAKFVNRKEPELFL